MNKSERAEAIRRGLYLWQPNEENLPQQLAYLHPADELLYGGQAGGGKTDLILGTALTLHKNSIIFRRTYKQLKAIKRRLQEILRESNAQFSGIAATWKEIPGERTIDLGAVQYEKDVWNFQGQPHDFIGFDELTQLTKAQYDTLLGWLRSTIPEQRCRVIAGSNPPPTAEGLWVIKYWAPWLDHTHPNPARPGELRWFVNLDGENTEVDGPDPIVHDDELLYPTSRTFIPARLSDNVYLLHDTKYIARLQALPEPLRSQLLKGDWLAGYGDQEWQVIPTAWILQAQARWKLRKKNHDYPDRMDSAGIDVARGGSNQTVIAPKHDDFIDTLIKRRGAETPDGQSVAKLARTNIPLDTMVNLDIVGVGGSAYDFMKGEYKLIRGVHGQEKSYMKDRSKKLEMYNTRAEMWWNMRELLDPTGETPNFALPDDPEVLADLAAPTYEVRNGRIIVIKKEKLVKILGRSPDCGDAICLAALRGKKLTFEQYMRLMMAGEESE